MEGLKLSLSEVPPSPPTATTDSPPRRTHLNSRGCQARRRGRWRDDQEAGGYQAAVCIEAEEGEPLAADWSLWRAFSRNRSLAPPCRGALDFLNPQAALLGPGRNDAECELIGLQGIEGPIGLIEGIRTSVDCRLARFRSHGGTKHHLCTNLGGDFDAVRASVDPRRSRSNGRRARGPSGADRRRACLENRRITKPSPAEGRTALNRFVSFDQNPASFVSNRIDQTRSIEISTK